MCFWCWYWDSWVVLWDSWVKHNANYNNRPANSHVLLWASRFQCKSHRLTTTQANFMGSPHCPVNSIYECHCNGVSDAYKMRPGVGNGHQLLLTAEKGCMFMRLNCVYTSCANDTGLYLGSFSLRNCRFSCNGCGLQTFLLGHTHQISRLLDKLGWQPCNKKIYGRKGASIECAACLWCYSFYSISHCHCALYLVMLVHMHLINDSLYQEESMPPINIMHQIARCA